MSADAVERAILALLDPVAERPYWADYPASERAILVAMRTMDEMARRAGQARDAGLATFPMTPTEAGALNMLMAALLAGFDLAHKRAPADAVRELDEKIAAAFVLLPAPTPPRPSSLN